MPELPEVEAWARDLTPHVSRAAIARVGPAHVATLKSIDPPLTELVGRRFEGVVRRGKNLLLPTADGELVVRVHLMTAGRLRFFEPGAKAPRTPAFSVQLADEGLLALTEAGKKKRAGVWLVTPAQLQSDLAHLGPDALELTPAMLSATLDVERRQLHPLLRDQRAIAGIGRAHANEILWRAKLSPFRISADLTDAERGQLHQAIVDDLEQALTLRTAGAADAAVYRVHGRLGKPCSACGTAIARVDFEEHTIYYCPTCQTGGRELKDRRLSRLLR